MSGQAYTSTIVSPVQLLPALASLVLIAAVWTWLPAPSWPLFAVICVGVLGAGADQASVRLAVGGDRLVLGRAWRRRSARVIPAMAVLEAHSETLSWAQVFGVGLPLGRRTSRLTVRPGGTLRVTLLDGEILRISTPDPATAASILMNDDRHDRR